MGEKEIVPSVITLLAGAEYKEDFAKENGHQVDVWIDDLPGTVQKSLELP